MKSRKGKILIALVFIGLIAGVERLSHHLTDGFSYPNISSSLPYQPHFDVETKKGDLETLKVALSQPYRYLESGSQSFVFISDDGEFVIKFFKHKRWRINPFYKHLPLPSRFAKRRSRWIEKKKETVAATFGSCKTAYTEFRDETGVIFVHLNKTPLFQKTLKIKDKLGFKQRIPLEKVEFVVQRKAIPTNAYLLQLKEEGKIFEAKKALQELFAFTEMRAKKGYSDKDPHLIHNFGFLGGKAVEIDIGGFHKDPKKDLTYFYSKEVKKIRRKLLPWIDANYSELKDFVSDELFPEQ
ncbi:MAG: hypothetical protein HRU43_06640 [Simkaniaceae bacterium]|nr:hypothetical protein [Simkaniaceae bacterium]